MKKLCKILHFVLPWFINKNPTRIEHIGWKPQPSWKPVQTMVKKLSKFTKTITHVDDMMIHNLVKYLVQTRLRLWDIKITNFKPESCPQDFLDFCYFYISQTNSSLDKIFYKIVYHHIIYMCDFFYEFRWYFCRGLHEFSRRLWFLLDMFPYKNDLDLTLFAQIFLNKTSGQT